jgi:hypothetical protein
MTSRIGSSWTTSPTGKLVQVEKRGRFPVSDRERRTLDGITFASLHECKRYAVLKQREKAGVIECLELQPRWEILINGKHFCWVTADFAYRDVETRRPVVEDSKTTGTQKDDAYRMRKRALELAHGIKIVEVLP